jgi:hypothetical protein
MIHQIKHKFTKVPITTSNLNFKILIKSQLSLISLQYLEIQTSPFLSLIIFLIQHQPTMIWLLKLSVMTLSESQTMTSKKEIQNAYRRTEEIIVQSSLESSLVQNIPFSQSLHLLKMKTHQCTRGFQMVCHNMERSRKVQKSTLTLHSDHLTQLKSI